jgi:5'-3' exonuclease
LIDAGPKPIYVFDGRRGQRRNGLMTSIEKAIHKMKNACKITPEIISIVIDWMKQELIQFFCAPFEAEWQCISLIMDGVPDCILSTDGDCVVLGAPKVVVELTISTKQCYIYDRSTVMLSLFVEKYNITVDKAYLQKWLLFLVVTISSNCMVMVPIKYSIPYSLDIKMLRIKVNT